MDLPVTPRIKKEKSDKKFKDQENITNKSIINPIQTALIEEGDGSPMPEEEVSVPMPRNIQLR